MNKIIIIGAVAAFGALAAGCNEPTPAPKVQQNVAAAKQDRATNVAEARREGNEAISSQRQDVAKAVDDKDYDVAIAKADGDYKVALESCKVLSGTAQADCKDRAAATLKADKAAAEQLKVRR
jgi:hypothetical protein